ncbi:MAG: AbrB/MazE/SpoVT family DNA-binding domain-containing protein [Deferribacteraceae bacterium]|jgi:virulence-associated protein VagC|nr:AbrB/MazE/SpoVT family DNA-binding domain-containing protein [Deferribacteraceae bacterium]
MKTAKIFMAGIGQAICLPNEFKLDSEEVYISKNGNSIVLIPKNNFDWNAWFIALDSIHVQLVYQSQRQVSQI